MILCISNQNEPPYYICYYYFFNERKIVFFVTKNRFKPYHLTKASSYFTITNNTYFTPVTE